jgi:AraC-like DNA-binding protein
MTQRMVPAAGAMIMLSYGVSRGLEVDALCGLIGYAPHQLTDPLRMVPFETSLKLWRALIARLPNENVGVGLGSFARAEHYGVFWEFLRHLATPLDMLRGYERFAPYVDSSCIEDPVILETLGDRVELRWPLALKYGIAERVECLNVAILATLERRVGSRLPPRFVRSRDREDPKRRLAARRYGCEVIWNSPDDALVFDLAALQVTLPDAQPQVAAALVDMLERKLLPDARLPFVERVRRVLELQVARGEGNQGALARALGLGVRSLQRELQVLGLRYADVHGEALKRVATALMRDRARSLQDIALELGYSETSSFARTWRRLTGETPTRYRERLLELEPTG